MRQAMRNRPKETPRKTTFSEILAESGTSSHAFLPAPVTICNYSKNRLYSGSAGYASALTLSGCDGMLGNRFRKVPHFDFQPTTAKET